MDKEVSHTNSHINVRKRHKTNSDEASRESVGKVIINEEQYNEIISFVKKNRSCALSAAEHLDVLALQAYLRLEHEKNKTKNGPGHVVRAPKVSENVARMLRHDVKLVKGI